jgi:hypothetical protein
VAISWPSAGIGSGWRIGYSRLACACVSGYSALWPANGWLSSWLKMTAGVYYYYINVNGLSGLSAKYYSMATSNEMAICRGESLAKYVKCLLRKRVVANPEVFPAKCSVLAAGVKRNLG